MANILVLRWSHSHWEDWEGLGDWVKMVKTVKNLGHTVFDTDLRLDAISVLSRRNIDLVITDQPVLLIEAQKRGFKRTRGIIVLSSFFLIANNKKCKLVKRMLKNLWGVTQLKVFPTQFDANRVKAAMRGMLAEPETIK